MNRRRFGALYLAGACLLLSAVVSAQKLHKDTRYGFEFKPPSDFQSVAVNPSEEIILAKYKSEDTYYAKGGGGYYEFYTLSRFPFPNDFDPDDWDEDPDEWLLETIERRHGYYEIERDKGLKIARIECRELTLLHPNKDPVAASWHVLIPTETEVYLISGTTMEDRLSKAKSPFSKSARSFKFIEKQDPAEREAELAQLSPQERFLQEQIDKLPPGWDSLRSDRYLFLYNAEKSFVKEIAEQIEGMRDAYEKIYPPDEPITAISIVRVLNSPEEYRAYGGPPGSGGYWSSNHKELVFYDNPPRTETLAVLNHEAFHQYIYYFYGQLSPHSWYNEGHGDYFAGAKLTKTYRVTGYSNAPGGFDRRGSIKNAVLLLKQGKGIDKGAAAHLKDLLAYSQQEYYAKAGVNYAAGWSVVHMLREARRLKPKEEVILSSYLENLLAARHTEAELVMEKALKKYEQAKEDNPNSTKPSDDPMTYYGFVDTGEVQKRAYATTFADWTDKDWEKFEEAWLEYVAKSL